MMKRTNDNKQYGSTSTAYTLPFYSDWFIRAGNHLLNHKIIRVQNLKNKKKRIRMKGENEELAGEKCILKIY